MKVWSSKDDSIKYNMLNAVVLNSLRPVSAGLGVLCAVFAVGDALTLSVNTPITLVMLGTSLALFVLSHGLGRWSVPVRWAHPIGVSIAGLVLLNGLLHAYFLPESQQTMNLMLLAIGVGCFFLSTWWLIPVLVAAIIGWVSVIWLAPPSNIWQNFWLVLCIAMLFPVAIHVLRRLRLESLHLQGTFQQVTPQEELQQSEESYRRLPEGTLEGIVIHDKGKILYANQTLASMFGYELSDIFQMEIFEFIVPEFRDVKLINIINRPEILYETVGLKKDRSTFPVEICSKTIPYQGRIAQVVTMCDLTERKRGETSLRESEQRYRDLFENTKDLIQSISKNNRIEYANRAWLKTLGYNVEELDGLSMYNIIAPSEQTRWSEIVERVISGEAIDHFETVFITKDDQQIPVEGSIHCKFLESEPVLIWGIFRDIVKHKEIVQTVSHEMRSALTPLLGSLRLVTSGKVGALPKKMKGLLEMAHNHSERLEKLIDDTLDLDKIESGLMDFNLEPLELMALAQEAIESNRAYGDEFKVKFLLAGTLEGIKVLGDHEHLMRVFSNLLTNAAKFSPPDSVVSLSVSRHGKSIRVAVSDRGTGIPEEFQPHVFQKFAQANGPDTRQKNGSGLGLSIAKAIVEKLDGKIGFETEAGVGTTFYFDLPEWEKEKCSG